MPKRRWGGKRSRCEPPPPPPAPAGISLPWKRYLFSTTRRYSSPGGRDSWDGTCAAPWSPGGTSPASSSASARRTASRRISGARARGPREVFRLEGEGRGDRQTVGPCLDHFPAERDLRAG